MYRLDEIKKVCTEHGLLANRPNKNRIDVHLFNGCILSFLNLIDENDTLVGFEGTPWHSHGIVQFVTKSNCYIECNEVDIIVGLICGELIIITQYLNSELKDRWIAHKEEPLDLKHIEAGEGLRVYRMT